MTGRKPWNSFVWYDIKGVLRSLLVYDFGTKVVCPPSLRSTFNVQCRHDRITYSVSVSDYGLSTIVASNEFVFWSWTLPSKRVEKEDSNLGTKDDR
jgi:hypothetical protein